VAFFPEFFGGSVIFEDRTYNYEEENNTNLR